MSEKLGPTGRYPSGKLCEHDKGEMTTSIGHQGGKVFINFGKPVAMVGFDPQGAADFAATVLKHARAAANEAGVPISFTLR